MKKTNIFLVMLFVGYIGFFFVANIVKPDVRFSDLENRFLSEKPEFSWETLFNGSFASSYETYITDQFVLRDNFVAIKSQTEQLFAKKEYNGVYLSTENTLIDKFSAYDMENIEKRIGYVSKVSENTEIPVYNVVFPMQNDIYKDKLPENAPHISEKELIDYLNANISGSIDVYDKLWSHRDEYIYYNTDHHWTSLGAYYAYTEIMQQLGLSYSELGEKTTVAEDFNGTIFAKSGVRFAKMDSIDIYTENYEIEIEDEKGVRTETIYDFEKLEESAKYSMFLGGDHPVVTIKGSGEGKIVIVKDSYFNSLVPFMVEDFEEIHLIDVRFMRLPVSEYAQTNEIDIILIAHSVNAFINEQNLIFLK